ncbi:unnamed protein product [Rotaria socialis]|uniref:Uncharacterized protein n=1 Tax=Rotaria socialis TaxID=392032 RepID=A0A818IQN3_9BILA|nr:unnamed protein product [Rotaria socialis]
MYESTFRVMTYALNFRLQFCCLRLMSTLDKAKEISQDPKLVDLAWKIAKRSVNLSSILIAAAGLITKWLLIQPIHNELVYKYRTNQSLYFVPYAFCKLTSIDEFSLITFPVACFLILILIISIKRTLSLPEFFGRI